MSRFVNTAATARFVLPGQCACPGGPHDEDYMIVRTELSTSDLTDMPIFASSLQNLVATLKAAVVEWNLLDDEGKAAPVTDQAIDDLKADQTLYEAFDAWADEHITIRSLPNASGAPSRNGSGGARSQTRTTRRRR